MAGDGRKVVRDRYILIDTCQLPDNGEDSEAKKAQGLMNAIAEEGYRIKFVHRHGVGYVFLMESTEEKRGRSYLAFPAESTEVAIIKGGEVAVDPRSVLREAGIHDFRKETR